MRITQSLNKQHIGWFFKKFWEDSKRRKVIDLKSEELLTKLGKPIIKSEDLLVERPERIKVDVVGHKAQPIKFDRSHPNWHDRPLLTCGDDNVLLEGLTQAKILTKTVEVKQGLPDNIVLEDSKDVDKKVREIIKTAHMFDAQQEKLPKIKDPERPAWNFPRTYGITQSRRNKLILTNLLHVVESTSRGNLRRERFLIDDLLFSFHFERFGNLIQFQLTGDSVLTSSKPLTPVSGDSANEVDLPDIFPVIPTVTLNKENIYKAQNIYPINLRVPKSHPHTVFIHHDETKVHNLFAEEVTEAQIYGRSLLKTFTVAASYARERFGNEVGNLPQPVTVQCVQTNGRLFNFGVLQLNTLDLEGDSRVKNVWYRTDNLPLFENCAYIRGKPTLEGYNNDVVKYLRALYSSV